jgi:hypothetical protein
MGKLEQRLLSAIVGIIQGGVSFYFINGWYTIIPWAIVALLVGAFSRGAHVWVLNGALFGYLLFVTYISLSYHSKTDTRSLISFSLFVIGFSLVGGAAGLIGAYMGKWLRTRFAPSDHIG